MNAFGTSLLAFIVAIGVLVAVHEFSGTWSEGKLRRLVRDLVAELREDGLEPVSEPMLARYNGPFTPWFMRRNEILVEVARRG